MAPTHARQQALLSTYCFVCDCARCVPPPDAPSHLLVDHELEVLIDGVTVLTDALLAERGNHDPLVADLRKAEDMYGFACFSVRVSCCLTRNVHVCSCAIANGAGAGSVTSVRASAGRVRTWIREMAPM